MTNPSVAANRARKRAKLHAEDPARWPLSEGAEMNEYTVTWTIEVSADSPREAAEQAWSDYFYKNHSANVFDVAGERIDLNDEEGQK